MLVQAAQNLINKLEEINKDPSFIGMFSLLWAHGIEYTGPNWTKELEELKMVLDKNNKELEKFGELRNIDKSYA